MKNVLRNEDLKIDMEFDIIDICGMMSWKGKFLGIGHKYKIYKGQAYKDETYSDYGFHVFQRVGKEKGYYKFAACKPRFHGINFVGFNVEKYGNDLEHLFVDFKQPVFLISDKIITDIPKSFNTVFSKGRENNQY